MTRVYPLSKKRSGVLPSVSLGPSFGDGVSSVAMSVGTVSVSGTTTAVMASKDAWVDNVALCPQDGNHGTEDLLLHGVIATRKDAYMGWDLTAYPAAASVSAASVTLNLKTSAPGGNAVQLQGIGAANEGWAEDTIRCSNKPALTYVADSSTMRSDGAAGVDQASSLQPAARTRIGERMGVGTFTVVLIDPGIGLESAWESKDEGTNNAAGPRLTFTWSKTL